MSIQERKLSFYFLGMEEPQGKDKVNIFDIEKYKEFCLFANSCDKKKKTIDYSAYNKRLLLSHLEVYDKQGIILTKGLVRAGKYNHSLDYLNEDGIIRETDKNMAEAYAEKTHFMGSVSPTGVELLFENRKSGASIAMVVALLNKLWKMKFSAGFFFCNPIAIDNLEESIERMNRIRLGHVYIDKEHFTENDDVFGSLNQMGAIQKDLILTLKSKRSETISKRAMISYLRKISSVDSKITRLRLEGTTVDGNTIIDTFLTKKINNILVELDDKGLVDDYSIFARMEEVFGVDE